MAKSVLDNDSLIKSLGVTASKASTKKGASNIKMFFADERNTPKEEKLEDLTKSMFKFLNGGDEKTSLVRLAFESDPTERNNNGGLYEMKLRLIPDDVLKRIAIQDDLVAAIVNARANVLSSFGRRQPDRFSTGFRIEPMAGIMEKLTDPAKKKQLLKDIELAERRLTTCGATDKWGTEERYMTFSQFLYMTTRNAVVNGRIASEIIYTKSPEGQGKKDFKAFRPLDVGTIFRAVKDPGHELENVRKQGLKLLEYYTKEKIPVDQQSIPDNFDWVQVIRGRVMQTFSDEECAVHNFYPVSDIELNGYPITPIDTIITQVVTHINIGEHNKLYFQSGRAARGMLVLESDSVDDDTIASIKQQFNASINSVQNAWRMPVFGINPGDKITWEPIDSGARDMEFQYLSDSNARAILSAFLMSPDELPGYTHLSRGSNSQALSEGDNEYKLTAARDVGLRPLMSQMEDFVNARLFPLIDPDLAKICTVKFLGLESLSPEKEATRIATDAPLHMTMDEVLSAVEKQPVGIEAGGSINFNQQWWTNLLQFRTKGWILEKYFGVQGAGDAQVHPEWAYCIGDEIDAQLFMAKAQMKIEQEAQLAMQPQPQGGDVQSGLEQVGNALTKSEARLPASVRRLIQRQERIITKTMDSWEADSKKLAIEVKALAKRFKTKKGQ
jgi:hypothetical protein